MKRVLADAEVAADFGVRLAASQPHFRFAKLADDLLGGVSRPLHLENLSCPSQRPGFPGGFLTQSTAKKAQGERMKLAALGKNGVGEASVRNP